MYYLHRSTGERYIAIQWAGWVDGWNYKQTDALPNGQWVLAKPNGDDPVSCRATTAATAKHLVMHPGQWLVWSNTRSPEVWGDDEVERDLARWPSQKGEEIEGVKSADQLSEELKRAKPEEIKRGLLVREPDGSLRYLLPEEQRYLRWHQFQRFVGFDPAVPDSDVSVVAPRDMHEVAGGERTYGKKYGAGDNNPAPYSAAAAVSRRETLTSEVVEPGDAVVMPEGGGATLVKGKPTMTDQDLVELKELLGQNRPKPMARESRWPKMAPVSRPGWIEVVGCCSAWDLDVLHQLVLEAKALNEKERFDGPPPGHRDDLVAGDEEPDCSDIPELGPEFFASAKLTMPEQSPPYRPRNPNAAETSVPPEPEREFDWGEAYGAKHDPEARGHYLPRRHVPQTKTDGGE